MEDTEEGMLRVSTVQGFEVQQRPCDEGDGAVLGAAQRGVKVWRGNGRGCRQGAH